MASDTSTRSFSAVQRFVSAIVSGPTLHVKTASHPSPLLTTSPDKTVAAFDG